MQDAYFRFFKGLPRILLFILKKKKKNVGISNTHSIFQILLSGVPQGSTLGPILFDIFIIDLLLWKSNSELLNFADDNTINAAEIPLKNSLAP